MNNCWWKYGLVILASAVLSTSCNTIKKNPGKILLTNTALDINNSDLDYYDLDGLIKQHENRRFLGMRMHTGVYNMGKAKKDRTSTKEAKIRKKIAHKREKMNEVVLEGQKKVSEANGEKRKEKIRLKYQKKKERLFVNEAEELAKAKRGLRSWLMNTIGEEPVFFDSLLTKQSVKQMTLYCQKHGYFNAVVSDSVRTHRKSSKVDVTYRVDAGTPYRIASFDFVSSDLGVNSYWNSEKSNSLLKVGDIYDEDRMESERMRINDDLKNMGYYAFSKSYIRYEVDSTLGNKTLSIRLIVNRPYRVNKSTRDSLEFFDHRRYNIRRIYVIPDYSITGPKVEAYDTLRYVKKLRSGTDTLYFLCQSKLRVKAKTISRKIYFKTNDYFNLLQANKTQSELSNLNIFKYINIRFTPDTTNDRLQSIVPLDAYVELSQSPVQSLNVEFEGTNSSGNLGTAGNIVYKNRNMFHGAEQFNFKVKGGLELQKTVVEQENDVINGLPFNSAEFSTEAGLSMPFNSRIFTQSNRPSLKFTTGFSYQLRPDYQRYISHLKATLEWRESAKSVMQVYLPINLVRILPDSLFAIRIAEFSRTIRYSYEDHFIPGAGFSMVSSNQAMRKNKPYEYLKLNVEQAGIMLWAGNRFNFATQGEIYRVLGINYSQYFKIDVDWRKYWPINQESMVVFRNFIGLGLPYGNSVLLPFEKSYSASGSNDVRAWKFRSLGPGIYSDSSSFDRTGDISLVFNLEYRFPIFSWFKGAFFVDAGNVWTAYQSEEFPGGVFKFGRFYKQLGVGPGFGLRMDFDFFIFRIDGAFPIVDPGKPEGEHWVGFNFKETNFSFGIGYPF